VVAGTLHRRGALCSQFFTLLAWLLEGFVYRLGGRTCCCFCVLTSFTWPFIGTKTPAGLRAGVDGHIVYSAGAFSIFFSSSGIAHFCGPSAGAVYCFFIGQKSPRIFAISKLSISFFIHPACIARSSRFFVDGNAMDRTRPKTVCPRACVGLAGTLKTA